MREGGCVKSVLKNALVDSHPVAPAVIQAPVCRLRSLITLGHVERLFEVTQGHTTLWRKASVLL